MSVDGHVSEDCGCALCDTEDMLLPGDGQALVLCTVGEGCSLPVNR